MDQQSSGTLAERVDGTARQTSQEVGSAIRDLAVSARELEMAETAAGLEATAEQLDGDTFELLVVGGFRSGKSTLTAALSRQAGVVFREVSGSGPAGRPALTGIADRAVQHCDAVLRVYHCAALSGAIRSAGASDPAPEGTKVFRVVNLYHGRPADDRVKGYVWNMHVRDQLGGPAWSGQDPASYGIHFVDAERARAAVEAGNRAEVEASGLAELERRLADFLLEQRRPARLGKYAAQAARLAEPVEQHVRQRIRAARAEQSRLRDACASALTGLADRGNRPAALPALFCRYRTQAEAALSARLERRFDVLSDGLGPFVAGAGAAFGPVPGTAPQDGTAKAIAHSVREYVADGLARWAEEDAQAVLVPLAQELSGDLERELTAIARPYAVLRRELTGLESAAGEEPPAGFRPRWLSAAGGFLPAGFRGPGAAAADTPAGWARGVVGDGFMAESSAAGPAAGAAGPRGLGASTASAALHGDGVGDTDGEQRLRAQAVSLGGSALRDLCRQLIPAVVVRLRRDVDALEATLTAEVTEAVAGVEGEIRALVDGCRQRQAELDREQARLTGIGTAVAGRLRRLQEALVTGRPVRPAVSEPPRPRPDLALPPGLAQDLARHHAAFHRDRIAPALARAQEVLDARTVTVVFGGHFSSGKSSLINCLIGRPLLPVGEIPETGVPCEIRSGPVDRFTFFDGHRSQDLLRTTESIARVVSLISRSGLYRSEVVGGERRLLLELARSPLPPETRWMDSPGINDTAEMTARSLAMAAESDVLVWVVNSRQPMSTVEEEFLRGHRERHGPDSVAVLVNVFLAEDTPGRWQEYLTTRAQQHRDRLETALDGALPTELAFVSARAAAADRDGYGGPQARALMDGVSRLGAPAVTAARDGRVATLLQAAAEETEALLQGRPRASDALHALRHHLVDRAASYCPQVPDRSEGTG
ncbi:dynamin family protein [Streptomyces sp. NPDC014891]|uniref:dynamin family protein n=1 Tax=Streptomyces sp. NPDC014891 TaxID=3364929 RepID=UPI003701F4A5